MTQEQEQEQEDDQNIQSKNNPIQKATVLWSTQSGRAKSCAKRCMRIVQSNFDLTVQGNCAVDDFHSHNVGMSESSFLNLRNQKSILLVLFISTTGDGEQCDSIRNTWAKLLRRSLTKDQFLGVEFALFALGDRAYGPQFCAAGRKLATRLIQLGARNICPIGFGDDNTPNGGVFADLDTWLNDVLIPTVRSMNVLLRNENSNISTFEVVHPCYQVEVTSDTKTNLDYDLSAFYRTMAPATAYSYQRNLRKENDVHDSKDCLFGKIMSNIRLTNEDWKQDVRHIDISVLGDHRITHQSSENIEWNNNGENLFIKELPYDAGDVAVVLPQNSDKSVQKLLDVLPKRIRKLADSDMIITPLNNSAPLWPHRCTLRILLSKCADINGRPEREFLRSLSAFISRKHPHGNEQAAKLIELSEPSGAALYADYIIREKRTYSDVFFDFDAVRWNYDETDTATTASARELTIEHLLSLLPPLYPRQFSIASSPTIKAYSSPNCMTVSFGIELCVAVVKEKTPFGREYNGVCSSFLSTLGPKSPPMMIWIKPGSFGSLPVSLKPNLHSFVTPVLYVGAGTGIAPLRSLYQERESKRLAVTNKSVNESSDQIVIFGCRKESCDYLYRQEWDNDYEMKYHLRLLTAFSQDHVGKVYVQHVLKNLDEGNFIANHILRMNGYVYIAGGAKMARCVTDEIIESLASHLSGGVTDARKVLKKLSKDGRFRVEAWN